jgi:hypothetical protein
MKNIESKNLGVFTINIIDCVQKCVQVSGKYQMQIVSEQDHFEMECKSVERAVGNLRTISILTF